MNPVNFSYYKKCKSENTLSNVSYDMSMYEYLLDANYNQNTIPSYNLTYLENEYLNLENKNSLNQIRLIRDITTDVFTKICIADNANINDYDFINFLFQYTYSNLLKDINSILVHKNVDSKNYVYPVLPNEFIYLYFKGGTLMKYFKNKIYEKKNIPNNNNSVPNDFIKNFKLSDTDMSIFIKTNINFRYEQIKHYCIVLLSNILKNIGDIIDYLKQHIHGNTIDLSNLIRDKKYNLSNKKIEGIRDSTFYNSIDEFKYILNNIKADILLYEHDITYKYINELFETHTHGIYKLTVDKNISSNPTENALIIELLNFILHHKDIEVKAESKHKIQKYKKQLLAANKYLNYQLLYKIKLLFSNYGNFKTELAKAIYNNIILNDDINEVYDFDVEPPIKYTINKDIFDLNPARYDHNIHILTNQLLDFDITRKDFMLAHDKNVSSNRLLIEFNNPNPAQNYISHNNTINIFKHNKTESFSLIRLKHLVSISNFLTTTDARVNNNINILNVPTQDPPQETIKPILYIPSELLDISIIQPYNNMNAYITNNSMNNYKYCIPISYNNDDNITSYIPSSNMEHLIYDLQYVLFMQNTIIPYHDMKYDKRIFRLLYFIKLNSCFHLKSYIENDNSIKTLYTNNYAIINDLINSYTITERGNIYTLTKHNNDIILNRLFTNYTIDHINIDLFIYDILTVNRQYANLKEFYIFVVLFSELIIINTDDSKNILYDICKSNLNKYKIINNFIIQDDINGYYTDFTQKFILFIKTIKEKINIINAHSLFT